VTRVGILVEPDFLTRHVGVRNYLLALHHYLALGADARFVSFFHPQRHAPNWFRIHLRDPRFVRDNGVADDWRIAGTPRDVFERYRAAGAETHADAPAIWYSQIGPRLDAAGFDTLVIGNPWLVDFTERLPVRRQVGIVYDAIPNRYCLTEAAKPFEFAHQHVAGFRYFRRHCDATLGISEAVTDDLERLFGFEPDQVGWLPPLVPVNCLDRPADSPPRTRGILLASPLDRRKGLEAMPRLIAAAGPTVEGLSMYGGVRCSHDELKAFFHALPKSLRVEWYPRATASTTERLFRSAKILLFPSLNEGLGLPLIEAQLRGCPAVTRDARPMSDLIVTGSRLLTDDPAKDAGIVRELFESASDHERIAVEARRHFRIDALPELVRGQILDDSIAPARLAAA
jgi:glycosyltransferase involved in cell wall biosynthesis